MAKTATATTTRTATRNSNARTTKTASEGKPKRAPSAYNLFMKEHMKKYREANPGSPVKEAMSHVAALWREAPENPNRGQAPKSKAAPKTGKENGTKRGRGRPPKNAAAKNPSSSETEEGAEA